jgi:hypothetical protein
MSVGTGAGADTIYIKRGSSKALRAKLQQGDGTAMPELASTPVRCQMRSIEGGTLTMDRVATVVNATTGEVEAIPLEDDVAVTGKYWLEWRVQYPGGDEVLPDSGYIRVIVEDDLA